MSYLYIFWVIILEKQKYYVLESTISVGYVGLAVFVFSVTPNQYGLCLYFYSLSCLACAHLLRDGTNEFEFNLNLNVFWTIIDNDKRLYFPQQFTTMVCNINIDRFQLEDCFRCFGGFPLEITFRTNLYLSETNFCSISLIPTLYFLRIRDSLPP